MHATARFRNALELMIWPRPRDPEGLTRPAIGAGPYEAWHAIVFDAVIERLRTRPNGLTVAEATERLERYGRNRLTASRLRSAFIRFLGQFHKLLFYVLLAAALVSALRRKPSPRKFSSARRSTTLPPHPWLACLVGMPSPGRGLGVFFIVVVLLRGHFGSADQVHFLVDQLGGRPSPLPDLNAAVHIADARIFRLPPFGPFRPWASGHGRNAARPPRKVQPGRHWNSRSDRSRQR